MRSVTYTDARANFADILDAAVEDHEEVIITRSGREAAVLISLADYNAIKETEYLLSNPANARRLRQSIADLEAGNVVIKTLDELVEAEQE